MIAKFIENRRKTAEAAVLGALYTGNMLSGVGLTENTGLGAGRLYPALMALEHRGLIWSEWAKDMTEEELRLRGGYRKRLYWLTHTRPWKIRSRE